MKYSNAEVVGLIVDILMYFTNDEGDIVMPRPEEYSKLMELIRPYVEGAIEEEE